MWQVEVVMQMAMMVNLLSSRANASIDMIFSK